MEKKSLSQQTADRLYTMIVVEHRLSPGEKLPSEVELARELLAGFGMGIQDTAPPCGRPSMSWSPKKSWRPAGGGAPLSPTRQPRSTTMAFPTWIRSGGS